MKILTHPHIKVIYTITFSFIGLFCTAQCPRDLNDVTIPSTNNLILYLPLDNDIENYGSGNFSAQLSGASYVPAKCNFGLEFDGDDDYLEISPSLNLIENFTITAWIKPYEQVNPMGIFSIREQCTTTYRGYSMALLGINEYAVTGFNYQVNKHQNCSGFSGGDRYINPTISISDNEDTFVAVTVQNNNSENRSVRLYVNCEEYTTEMALDLSTSESFNSSINYITTIGASSNVNGYVNSFDGVIDEVRVYSEVLDQESLLDIYFQCLPIEIEVNNQQECDQDTTFITIHNTEPDMVYQVIDITNNIALSNPLDGNCDSIMFIIEPLPDPTSLQIKAENILSGCNIFLDTIIYVDSDSEFIYEVNTTNLCIGDSILIGNEYIYENTNFIDTTYSLDFCDSIINTSYVFFPYPTVNLGEDTTLCFGNTLLLNANGLMGDYIWQDESTNPTYEVTTIGEYSVSIENGCAEISDNINVQFLDCCNLYVPNVFSPNFDGVNDKFKVLSAANNCDNISSFSMKIFNRWGAFVFESNDINIGWDGTFRGIDANKGVYIYVIEYFNGFNHQLLKGNITLIK